MTHLAYNLVIDNGPTILIKDNLPREFTYLYQQVPFVLHKAYYIKNNDGINTGLINNGKTVTLPSGTVLSGSKIKSVYLFDEDTMTKNDSGITDENGHYVFHNVPPGYYKVIVNGYPRPDQDSDPVFNSIVVDHILVS